MLVLAGVALFVVVAATSAFATARLLFSSEVTPFDHPAWSNDGRTIAFLKHSRAEGASETEIYLANADGTRQRRIARMEPPEFAPQLSPDMRRVAFLRNRCAGVQAACSGITTLHVMHVGGSGSRRIARAGSTRTVFTGQPVAGGDGFSWSPDGRRIAFLSDRDGTFKIYVVNADGSGETRLTDTPASDSHPVWSPDGRKIAFVSGLHGGGHPQTQERKAGIYVVNTDGSGLRLLARGHAPAWSPDGRRLVFRSDRHGNGEVYVVNVDGSGERRLTHNLASDGGPVWAPDGASIYFVRFRRGNGDIYVMNADGTRQQNLTPARGRHTEDRSPAISPDGRRIAFVSNRDGRRHIYVMNADGTEQTSLSRESGRAELFPSGRVLRSVDGVRFSFSVPRRTRCNARPHIGNNWNPPTCWENGPVIRHGRTFSNRSLFLSRSTVRGQAAEAVIFWTAFPDGGEAFPCKRLLDPTGDRSSADLAAAMGEAPGLDVVQAPTNVRVGGRRAHHVVVRVRGDLGCDPGHFFTWRPRAPRGACWGACWLESSVGDTISVWIIEVQRRILVIQAETSPDAGKNVALEMRRIIASVRFA